MMLDHVTHHLNEGRRAAYDWGIMGEPVLNRRKERSTQRADELTSLEETVALADDPSARQDLVDAETAYAAGTT
jgi:hypothetical protein